LSTTPAEKIRVTGIFNFDDCRRFHNNRLPHRHYVLVCTSDPREKYRRQDRVALIRRARQIAALCREFLAARVP